MAATVLIGFGNSLSAPEVVWSLAGSGFRVVAFVKRGTRPALRKSRFVELEYVTDPAVSVDRALSDIHNLIRKLNNPVLMSLDDESVWLIQELSKRTPVRVAGPTGAQAEIALDKRLQLDAASKAGFAIPETKEIQGAADLDRISSFPAMVKPALAARTIDGRLGRGVSHGVADAGELAALQRDWEIDEPMLAQPMLKGVGEGLFGLALEDRLVCWSGHRRVRMMNPIGSGSSACVSIKPGAEICAAAERFLKQIGWRGMFMIELLRDSEGRAWFMELNGRSWGSMALARRMGFEYPDWAVRYRLDPAFVPSAPLERPPVLCRHLGRELLHLAFVWRGAKSEAFDDWPSRWSTFRTVLNTKPGDAWYNHNKNDRNVFWADTFETLSSHLHRLWNRNGSRSVASRVLSRMKAHVVRYQQARLRASGEVFELVDGSKHILFLCYGNINRSALAEQHLRQLAGSGSRISSCGFHAPDRRPLDPMMYSLAREQGILFDKWSSRTIDSDLVAQADLIFAMEARHLVRLFTEYPETRRRAFLLSCVTKRNTIPLEIRDPAGGTPDAYRRCIQEVTSATASVADKLRPSMTKPA